VNPLTSIISFKEYLSNRNGWSVNYNNKQLQSSDSNVCGAHVLFYAYKKCHKKYGLSTLINRYYLNDVNFNDCSVLCFVSKKFKLKKKYIKLMLKSVPFCALK